MMNIQIAHSDLNLRYLTRLLVKRMVNPLCGLNKGISLGMRSSFDPCFMSAGAELTGVNFLLNEPMPKPGSYHIGGSGVIQEEVLIRVLAETTERYAHIASELGSRYNTVTAQYDEMITKGERIIGPEKLRFFSEDQYNQSGFPFQSFRRDAPMSWVRAKSLLEDETILVPNQIILIGYRPQPKNNERWLLSAVTTGTAAHTKPELALRNAILELIQIDSAMGHWYSSAKASQIVLDIRTEAIENLIRRHFDKRGPTPKFYWLPNPDFTTMTVACVIKQDPEQIPAAAIGLGCDMNLVDAMYKALLEAVGVVQMAKVVLLFEVLNRDYGTGNGIDPTQIFDLDLNVAYYALPENSSIIDSKFVNHTKVKATDLPPDSTFTTNEEIRLLVDRFRSTNKELVYLDLTTEDIRELGFVVIRIWSPDMISLCLPSTPPLCHPRFEIYGGVDYENPHPYP